MPLVEPSMVEAPESLVKNRQAKRVEEGERKNGWVLMGDDRVKKP